MELQISQKQTQGMIMTPQLQQAIKLLQLNHQELNVEIYDWMMQNPLLDLAPPADSAEAAAETSMADPGYDQTPEATPPEENQFAEVAQETEAKIREEFDWENYLGEYSSSPSTSLGMGSHETPEETPGFETFMATRTSLTDHLIWQWRFVAKNQEDYQIGESIIGNLDDDGYLVATLEEIAAMTGSNVSEVTDTLKRFQQLDPAGIAARDLSECLLLQLDRLNCSNTPAAAICRNHLKLLEKKDLQGLCRALNCESDTVAEAVELVRSLDPKPGRAYSQTDPIYVTPDVYITKIGDEYVITLNEDGLPKLRFNKAYRRMLNDKNSSDETRKYLSEKLKGAAFLIRSIHQRQRTIYRVTESIFKFQRDFLDKGIEHLKPLVLRDVALDINFHESTISRVTTNKYVDTPRGVFELKYFFDSPINRFHGDSLSSESVKNRIKNIIGGEDPKKPLSDQKIVEILQGSNIKIARRTVAKYREILGLGSSAERKQMF
ncbi:MAG: RNA polymerase factor sigma-54 [Deltaproteobacteria bacterium]|nr:RNA polymerase factor sigma-54 [Deltaproteobacteria bacterium]